MNETIALFLTFIFQLFLIVDPVAGMPILLSITKSNSHKERQKMVKTACIAAAFVLLVFALFSKSLLSYFSISIEAIQIGGGILLFFIGLEMIYGRNTRTEMVEEEHKAAIVQEDISITPLAMPLLAGPGAITTTILFSDKITAHPFYTLWACLSIIVVMVISYLFLVRADVIFNKLGKIGTKVVIRFMGLIVIFISVQYVMNGVKSLF